MPRYRAPQDTPLKSKQKQKQKTRNKNKTIKAANSKGKESLTGCIPIITNLIPRTLFTIM